MTPHPAPLPGAQLHRYWPLPIAPGTPPDEALGVPADIDHLAREQALRERDHERRLLAHPDPRDPEHPEEREL